MSKLLDNPKREAFAQYLSAGVAQGEAYRQAGYSSNRGAASRLAANVNIKQRVRELQAERARELDISVEVLTEMLLETHEQAVEKGDLSNQRLCVESLAKLHGLMVGKADVSRNGKSRWTEDRKDVPQITPEMSDEEAAALYAASLRS